LEAGLQTGGAGLWGFEGLSGLWLEGSNDAGGCFDCFGILTNDQIRIYFENGCVPYHLK
jgi:hypothetical protein